jgi:hypothetical protein
MLSSSNISSEDDLQGLEVSNCWSLAAVLQYGEPLLLSLYFIALLHREVPFSNRCTEIESVRVLVTDAVVVVAMGVLHVSSCKVGREPEPQQ